MNWAMVTLFGRWWRRLLFSVVLGLDLLLILEGIRTARRVFRSLRVVVLFARISDQLVHSHASDLTLPVLVQLRFKPDRVRHGNLVLRVLLTTYRVGRLPPHRTAADDAPT